MDSNPYNCNSPVTGSQFFGRSDLLLSLQQALGSPTERGALIYGLPRYGKSSLLQEFAGRLTDQNSIPIYWGFKDKAPLSWQRTLQALAQAMVEKAPGLEIDPPVEWNEVDFVTDFLPQVVQVIAPKRLVLLLDDIDIPLDEDSHDDANSIARLIQELIAKEVPLDFVLSTGTKVEKLPPAWAEIGTSLKNETLPPLRPPETEALIAKLSRAGQITYTANAVEMIIRYSAGHPFLIQLICHEVFTRAGQNHETQITTDTIVAALPMVFEKSSPAIRPLVADLSDQELATLTACADLFGRRMYFTPKDVSDDLQKRRLSIDEKTAGVMMAGLEQRGLLSKEMQGVYAFRVPLMARWVMATYSPKSSTLQGIASRGNLLIGLGVFLVAVIASIAFWSQLSTSRSLTTPTGSIAVVVETPTNSTVSTASPTPTPRPPADSTAETAAAALVVPTSTPTATPTPEPTEEPTATPTPTSTPTSTATATPSATPTEPNPVEPTDEPSPTPTATATLAIATVPSQVQITATSTVTAVVPLPSGLQILDLDVTAGSQPAAVYAAAKDEGVYRRDLDGSWSLFSNNLADAGQIRTVGSRARSGQLTTLYTGYADGARRYREADGWSAKSALPRFYDFVAIPDSTIVFAGSDKGIYRSLDDGNTWEPVNLRLNGRLIEIAIYGLALGADSVGNWTVYAAGGDSAVIFKTTVDPAAEALIQATEPRWEDVPCQCEASETFYAIAADPTNDQIIYVGSDRSRVSFSSDGGMTWTTTTVPVGQAQEVFVTEIEVAPGNTAVYAASGGDLTPFNSNGLLVLTSENNWSAVLPPGFIQGRDYVASIAIDPNNPQSVYVGASTGLFKFDRSTQGWLESPQN
jgi:hypothetical protein